VFVEKNFICAFFTPPIHIFYMFLDSGGRLEHPEETHTDMGRTCNLTERSPGSVRTPTTKQSCPIFEPII